MRSHYTEIRAFSVTNESETQPAVDQIERCSRLRGVGTIEKVKYERYDIDDEDSTIVCASETSQKRAPYENTDEKYILPELRIRQVSWTVEQATHHREGAASLT